MSRIKLIAFDMDGTLLRGKSIFSIAEKIGFYDKLMYFIRQDHRDYYERSIEIAKLLKNINTNRLLQIFRSIPLEEGVEEVIKKIKSERIITAIITASYLVLADDLKSRIGIDYAYANNLIINKNIITGELEINNLDLKKDSVNGKIYSINKSSVLEKICKNLNIDIKDTIAVGDGLIDRCMIAKAGIGIAFKTNSEVQNYADVTTDNLSDILKYI